MCKTKPKIEKGLEDRGTGRFYRHQSKSSNFMRKKEKSVGRCEDIRNDVFDLVLQGQTELFSNSLKDFYCKYEINLQKNGSGMQYTVRNLSKPTLAAPK